ncbi:YXWGXW repeat-containing protein [Variovorax sp. OK605]|uniref:YXWGXW repeat-containing protein n=1 Tax=Variovorax sp. OK605 TaxID=1855317 RepID=UPI0008E4D2D2|nr:YXWGXW repeat-containing protein [Variovorax sp. OK605]SFP31973.1 YXWGXW repeat-containing protein [Variovorax sp. OK605]
MKIRLAVLAVAGALSILASPLAANAQVSVNINVPGLVMAAPPPPRYEPLPPPRGGFVWVPGRWAWDGRAYAWHQGGWQRERAGYVYAPGRWTEDRGGWRWAEGDWRQREAYREARHEREREREWNDRDDHRRHDRDHGRGHDHGDRGDRGDRGRDFCPPGQAKKGNC